MVARVVLYGCLVYSEWLQGLFWVVAKVILGGCKGCSRWLQHCAGWLLRCSCNRQVISRMF